MNITLIIVGSYLVGSLPTAYLVAKYFGGVDLRIEGSRNIGARNAYEVTSKKSIGIIVLTIDMLKAIVPLYLLEILSAECSVIPMAAAAIVFGHCYPIWLKFHGGRGLATAAAVAILLSPITLVVWIAGYIVVGFIKRQVHIQALTATIICIGFELLFNSDTTFGILHCSTNTELLHYSIPCILLTILSRHIQPVRMYFKAQ